MEENIPLTEEALTIADMLDTAERHHDVLGNQVLTYIRSQDRTIASQREMILRQERELDLLRYPHYWWPYMSGRGQATHCQNQFDDGRQCGAPRTNQGDALRPCEAARQMAARQMAAEQAHSDAVRAERARRYPHVYQDGGCINWSASRRRFCGAVPHGPLGECATARETAAVQARIDAEKDNE